MNRALSSHLEPLESRIAPAFLTFPDLDGDVVKVTVSTGELVMGEDVVLSMDGHFKTLDLSGFAEGTTVSIVATKSVDGDGFIDVGEILALGINLGTVTVDGDLGRIVAGSNSDDISAVKSLTVRSMGLLGTVTGIASLSSSIDGKIDKLNVLTHFQDAKFQAEFIGSVNVGGNVAGGNGSQSGNIIATQTIGPVTIGGDLIGGSGHSSGRISGEFGIASVLIKGSALGGEGEESGALRVDGAGGKIGKITVLGDVIGSSGLHSARLYANMGIGPVSIGGSLVGGTSEGAGRIYAGAEGIGPVTIGGDLVGGSAGTTGGISTSGSLGAITVKGSVVSVSPNFPVYVTSSGKLGQVKVGGSFSGEIYAPEDFGGLTVGRDFSGDLIIGSDTDGDLVTPGLQPAKLATVGAIKVGGSVLDADIAIIGNVKSVAVGKDFLDSDLRVLGDIPTVSIGGDFNGSIFLGEEADIDPVAPNVQPSQVSNLGSLKIGGSVLNGLIKLTGNSKTLTVGKDFLGEIRVYGEIGVLGIGGNASAEIEGFGETGAVKIGGGFEGEMNLRGDTSSVTIGRDLLGSILIGDETDGDLVAPNVQPAIVSNLTSLKIGGNVFGRIAATGDTKSITIGQDIIGGDDLFDGYAVVYGDLQSLVVGGSVIGGEAPATGVVGTMGKLVSVRIGGNVVGGTFQTVGAIFGGESLGSLTIGGSLIGGAGFGSGTVGSFFGDIGTVKIGRDIIGGTGNKSGGITSGLKFFGLPFPGEIADHNIGTVTVGGSLLGGNLASGASGSLTASGFIHGKNIGSVVIARDIRAGLDLNGNTDTENVQNASILAAETLGAVTVKGGIYGSIRTTGEVRPQIIAAAETAADVDATAHLVIKSLTVGKNVERADIRAGLTHGGEQIGPVKVNGDWIASNLLAGMNTGSDFVPGTTDDSSFLPFNAPVVSKIASITIGGRVLGTAASADAYSFAAQQIGPVKIGGSTFPVIPMDPATHFTTFTQVAEGTTGDVYAHLAGVVI